MKTVSSCAAILLFALAVPAHAVGLPDTGQDTCYDDNAAGGMFAPNVADGVAASDPASIARDAGSHPRQDCRYGRDAAAAAGVLTKTGAGAKGFDYSKIANNGATLAAGAALGTNPTDWACTKDNITGLTWEVKTPHGGGGLRDSAHTYSWYSTDAATNGGDAGTANGGACSGGTGCDTENFVADVNAAALCGYADWRMPTKRELLTLVYADGSLPSIDITYFPNTETDGFWSGSPCAWDQTSAWYGDYPGYSYVTIKSVGYRVRLVRGGQF